MTKKDKQPKQDSWEADFENRFTLFRGNQDMMKDFIRTEIEKAERRERTRILKELEAWNESGAGYMSDCLGCYWKELLNIINKLNS